MSHTMSTLPTAHMYLLIAIPLLLDSQKNSKSVHMNIVHVCDYEASLKGMPTVHTIHAI